MTYDTLAIDGGLQRLVEPEQAYQWGTGEQVSPEFGVGDANANCPPDFVMFHTFKHQNRSLHAQKNHVFFWKGPSPFLNVRGIPPILHPSPQTKPSGCTPALP